MKLLEAGLILKTCLDSYYLKDDNFIKLYDMLVNPKISLRVIDWFVTNYSKKYNIIYDVKMNNKKMKLNVFTSYKSQLKSYSKKYFDPFCRRERITIKNNGKEIVTTYGQLNFFKWAIQSNIIIYIQDNYTKIEKDMNESIVYHNKLKKNTNCKRKELSKSSYNRLNVVNKNITLYFD